MKKSCSTEDFDVYSTYDDSALEFNSYEDEQEAISELIYQRPQGQNTERKYYD